MTPTQNPTQQLRTDLNMAVSWTIADLRGYEDIAPDYEMLEARLAVLKRARKLAKAEAAAAHDLLFVLKRVNEEYNEHFGITDQDEPGNTTHEMVREAIAKAEEGRA